MDYSSNHKQATGIITYLMGFTPRGAVLKIFLYLILAY